MKSAIRLPLVVLLVSMASTLAAQSAGTFQFGQIERPSIEEPPPDCSLGVVCEIYSRVNVVRVGGSAGTVSVDVSIVGGTATNGTDYGLSCCGPDSSSVRLFFVDGFTTGSAVVLPIQDFILEPSETVVLQLTNPLGGAVIGSPNTATVTILDTSGRFRIPTMTHTGAMVMTVLVAAAGSVVLFRRL